MSSSSNIKRFHCLKMTCGQLPVVVGSGTAADLAAVSFADVLDDDHQAGYQRPFDAQHSREFRRYIEKPGASTIPLTFNLRGNHGDRWKIVPKEHGIVVLEVRFPEPNRLAAMAQVDCQHRLGSMADSPIELTFQCYLGLSEREEMAIFNVINGKAKGLSSSLLDYHKTKLTPGLETVQLDLFIAKALHDDSGSVWHKRLKLGGDAPGTKRRVSLRSLQVATKMLLQRSLLDSANDLEPSRKYEIVRDFWSAVSKTWPHAWTNPRTHLLTKGIGVTALSLLAGDIVTASVSKGDAIQERTFMSYLASLKDIDWTSNGAFKGYGGRHGAAQAHRALVGRLFGPALACA